MVTLNGIREVGANRNELRLFGLSTDEKPLVQFEGMRLTNGSYFYEMDTTNVSLYDEENDKWHLQ